MKRAAWLVALIIVTSLAYLPSLRGRYVLDDYPNIVDNAAVHMTTFSWDALRTAFASSPSDDLPRPLAMLTFALNWYATGADPSWMKLANLIVHLANGLLVFVLIRVLARAANPSPNEPRDAIGSADRLALIVAAAWLLAPINFTAVGYVVQRMESLSQLCVLGGLCAYVATRAAVAPALSTTKCAVALILGTTLGCAFKESALLLPLYACIAEACVFGFRSGGRIDRHLVALFVVTLLIPGFVALIGVVPHFVTADAYANRAFTLGERVLTEPRILIDYFVWTFLPLPRALSLYHDEIAVSRDLFHPLTTLLSIAALTAGFVVAIALRRSRPLIATGILWFLAAHLMTASVIPLELAFEHRNYFASIGALLAASSAFVAIPADRWPVARIALGAGLIVLFACVTFLRALEWGNPVGFALAESQKNPHSLRATYELGRTYVVLSGFRADSPFLPLAFEALERGATLPGSDTLADQGLLILASRTGHAIEPAWWTRIHDKLRTQPVTSQDVTSLYALAQCAISRKCTFAPEEMVGCFTAALTHTRFASQILSIYASYAINVLGDRALALNLVRESIVQAPRDLQLRRNLVTLLIESRRKQEASAALDDIARDFPGAARDAAVSDLSRQVHSMEDDDPPKP
jgi:hypothetical protein